MNQEEANEVFGRIQEALNLHVEACRRMLQVAQKTFDIRNPFRRGYCQALTEEIDRLEQSIAQLETAKRPVK